MKITIWGNRSSLPSAMNFREIRNKIYKALEATLNLNFNNLEEVEQFVDEKLPFSINGTYGTNTSCVEIQGGEEYIILDAGTGLRDFGNSVLRSGKFPCCFNIFVTNLYWDHVHGFPFFVPAFIKGNQVKFYGCNDKMEEIFVKQQNFPYFPVPINYMMSEKQFNIVKPGKEYKIADFLIKVFEYQDRSIAYSFEKDKKKIIYSIDYKNFSDFDPKNLPVFFKNCDLLILSSDNFTDNNDDNIKANNKTERILSSCINSEIKHICLHYNNHTIDDQNLEQLLFTTRKIVAENDKLTGLKISVSYDGLEIII